MRNSWNIYIIIRVFEILYIASNRLGTEINRVRTPSSRECGRVILRHRQPNEGSCGHDRSRLLCGQAEECDSRHLGFQRAWTKDFQ